MSSTKDLPDRRSVRYRCYDYAWPGAYFVTICTQKRECLFGEIHNGVMCVNGAGTMLYSAWSALPGRFPFIALDSFIVMPNHVHGIILILTSDHHPDDGYVPEPVPRGTPEGSLGRIIQAFKSQTTVEYTRGVHQHGWPQFSGRLWQRSYHEHIIRSERAYEHIKHYVDTNPQLWDRDRENPFTT